MTERSFERRDIFDADDVLYQLRAVQSGFKLLDRPAAAVGLKSIADVGAE